jgi:hypothetical protein
MRNSRISELVIFCFAFTVLIFMLAATLLVSFSELPQIFNQRTAVFRVINLAAAIGIACLILGLLASGLTPRLRWLKQVILLCLTFCLTLEVLFCVFDNAIVSVNDSPLAWAFRNVSVDGQDIYLPQSNAESPFGFHQQAADTPKKDGYRILFLGNSFVSGSGSSFAVNYPQATEANLRAALPTQNVTVFSAGVDGFGVKEDRLVYQYLLDQKYQFDAVVLNFTMESDPTNDMPGTVRRVIAGEPQRLHENWFLRMFYPLNSYVFRYAVYLDVLRQQNPTEHYPATAEDASCAMTASFASSTRERAYYYYGPGAQDRLYINYNMDQLERLATLVKANHAQFFVVLLPDPNATLLRDREYYAKQPMDWDWSRRTIISKIDHRWPVLDLSPNFLDHPDLFRCNSVHWNDKGNVAGARYVADFLARDIESR